MIHISSERIPVKKNRIIAYFIHYSLKTIFFFCNCITFKKINKNDVKLLNAGIKKILILRLDGLGDIVMSTPGFNAVRDIFPDANISLLASERSKELVEVMPAFNRIIYFNAPWFVKKQNGKINRTIAILKTLGKEKFDLIIDLRGDFRNNVFMYFCSAKYRLGLDITGCGFLLTHIIPVEYPQHLVDSSLSLIKFLDPGRAGKYSPRLYVTEEDRKNIEDILRNNAINYEKDLLIVIHPGANWYGRRWLPERYARVADLLIEKYNAKIIITGSKDDSDLVNDIINKMKNPAVEIGRENSLREFIALLEKTHLFIGVDSGPMHMAAAMGVPVVALFGPAKPEAVGPYGDKHIVITKQEKFNCSPCSQTICEKENDSCLKAIGVEDVWNGVVKQINRFYKK